MAQTGSPVAASLLHSSQGRQRTCRMSAACAQVGCHSPMSIGRGLDRRFNLPSYMAASHYSADYFMGWHVAALGSPRRSGAREW